jgi:Tfp pilus assembly protein PilN
MNPKKKQKIEIVGLLVGIWFILSLPLPWLITMPDLAQQQLLIILQMTGLVSIPFVGLAVAWTLKPELANRDLKYD